ncbi:protein chibby homolog 1-like [Symsagittifera roscoffensis]|uniref:protein chibby homolog 1-like n=1 Tax=Symsagittifera roscoffensis TaxID=84072 RepID=UPI00307BEF26
MGIFGTNPFQPKRVPERRKKAESLNELSVNEPDTRAEFERDKHEASQLKGAKLRTNSGELVFLNGAWKKVSHGEDEKECAKIEEENAELEEKNNLLKLQIETLLDLVTEHSASVQTLEKELANM